MILLKYSKKTCLTTGFIVYLHKFKFYIMKKVFLSAVAIAALTLASCGGKSAEDVTKEYCECVEKAGEDAEKLTKCATDAAEAAKDVDDYTAPKAGENPCK